MRINLTDYDSDIVYKALIKCKESAPIFAGQIGNSYLQRLANRFKVNDLAAPDHKQEHNLANPSLINLPGTNPDNPPKPARGTE